MNISGNKTQGDAGQKKWLTPTNIIIITGFVIVLAAIGVFGYIYISSKDKAADAGQEITPYVYGSTYLVDETNLEEIEAQIAKEVEEGMFITTMNVIWNFESSSKASYDAVVANDPNNHRDAFIEVVLQETEQLVYKSTVIPVGSALKEVKLSQKLKAGTYPAVCTYHLLDRDTGEIASSLSIEITININS